MEIHRSQSSYLESNDELDQLLVKSNHINEDQVYKCGEAYFFSNTGTIQVRCTLCEACFNYGNESYLKHIFAHYFDSSLLPEETQDSEFSLKLEDEFKHEIKTQHNDIVVKEEKYKFSESDEINEENVITHKIEESLQILDQNLKLEHRTKKYKSSAKNINAKQLSRECKSIYNCSDCSEEFKKKIDLKLHKKLHKNDSKTTKEGLICEQCGRKFVHKNTLESHYENTHNPNRELFPCVECGKSFTNTDSLMAHNRHYHTKELPYICEIEDCNKRYASQRGLKYHQGKHSNRTFSCTECNKQYSHKNKLQTHYKRHHLIGKIYHCDQCDKSFYNTYFLNKHMVCHTNERPFLCDQCPANFPREKALVAHKKIHSGLRDEVCQLCEQAFNLYEGLYQHMKIRHGIKYYRGMTLEDMHKTEKQNENISS